MRFQKSLLLSMPRPDLWTLLANTDRFNREIGLPRVSYAFSPRETGGAAIHAQARFLGQKLAWREMPFEWVEPEWFEVRRIHQAGPFREILCGVRLEETPEGFLSSAKKTRATSFAEVTPRNFLGRILAPILIGGKALNDFEKACRSFEAFHHNSLKTPFPNQSATARPVNRNRLAGVAADLRGSRVGETLLARLLSHVESAADVELIRFRPFDLADTWGAGRCRFTGDPRCVM